MSNRNKKWRPGDDERLLKLSDAGVPLPVIANVLGRSPAAVENRLIILNNHIDPALRAQSGGAAE
jgi:hypothetical protein